MEGEKLNPDLTQENPTLKPKAEVTEGGGVAVYFESQDAARQAVQKFWEELAPDLARNMIGHGSDFSTEQITDGTRTEPWPVIRKELKDEGYQYAVWFNGNGVPLQGRGEKALIKLGLI